MRSPPILQRLAFVSVAHTHHIHQAGASSLHIRVDLISDRLPGGLIPLGMQGERAVGGLQSHF